jgi:allantoinase
MDRFGLHSTRVLIGNDLVGATVIVNDRKIEEVVTGSINNATYPITDFGDAVIMPGLIDSHVHINEPGRSNWEGFDTATKAAAAGGITTLVDMPLNSSPVTIDKQSFEEKRNASKGKLHVNCGFWGGIVPQNIASLDELIQSGVLGIKAFLTHSGIDEFPNVTKSDLQKGLSILKKHQVPLLVHAELTAPHADAHLIADNPTSYQAYLKSRPKAWEDHAISMMIDLCQEFNTPVHIVHLSSANSIAPLTAAKASGVPITVETCPQYLFFNAEDIPDGQTAYKCAPPIREQANNEQLWQALKDGLFNFIVTDHSPAIPDIKEIESGNLKEAWGGIASLQFSLPAMWTKAKERGFELSDIANLMSTNVAEFLKLGHQKGQIAAGYDADLVIWNPEKTFEVKEKDIHYKHKISPYIGQILHGVINQTYVNGYKVFDNGTFSNPSKGEIIKRATYE